MAEKNYKAGFGAGWRQLQLGDKDAATADLWAALEITNKWAFYRYRDGVKEVTASQAVAVEAAFAKYGITSNIWGE